MGLPSARPPARLGTNIPARVASGRRVRAARVLAGNITIRELATAAGLGYRHLANIEAGIEPLTSTDVVDLAVVLDCPAAWLRDGWTIPYQ